MPLQAPTIADESERVACCQRVFARILAIRSLTMCEAQRFSARSRASSMPTLDLALGAPLEQLLLTREQASHVLAIGLTKLDQLIADGHIPTVDFVGRARRIPRAALERLVEESQTKPA